MKRNISPIFLGLTALFILSGYQLYQSSNSFWAFIFIVNGWVISLSLHEFGHAFSAFIFGDKSVLDKGYLTLNPLKYTNLFMSIILPLIFLLMGGIGFPGGAVYINMNSIRTAKQRSITFAAGPLANIIFCIILLFFIYLGQDSSAEYFIPLLSLLAFLQITAVFLNLLPLPGLDGFGIIMQYLPAKWIYKIRDLAGIAFLLIFFLLFQDTPVSRIFWSAIAIVSNAIGINFDDVREGFDIFKFWN